MGSFAWRNTAVNRLEKFLQKLPGVRQGARCRGLGTTSADCEANYQSGSHESCSGFSRPLSPKILTAAGETQVRYPKEIPMKGITYCIPSHAARDYSLSLAVPEFIHQTSD